MTLPPTITSRSNARVKALRAAFSGKASQPGELVGIEGETLLLEAIGSGVSVHAVFLREGAEANLRDGAHEALRQVDAGRLHVLSSEVFDSAVGTVSPQGVAAIVEIPVLLDQRIQKSPGTVLVLEDIQDPGNLGTLIRSAEAFGVEEIFVTPGCANSWGPKVIRASAGSIFRKPVHRMAIVEALTMLRGLRVHVAGAIARSDEATPSPQAHLSGAVAILIGNEGAGLTHEALALVDERVNIPCQTESLNAAIAGSLLLYEAQRQNAGRILDEEHGVETA